MFFHNKEYIFSMMIPESATINQNGMDIDIYYLSIPEEVIDNFVNEKNNFLLL